MAYEQKPNTFSLFKDGDDRIAERIDLVFRDIAIPFVIRRHEQSAAEIGIRTSFELRMLGERTHRAGKEEQGCRFHDEAKGRWRR